MTEHVDVAGPTRDAWQAAETYAEKDPTYSELMATYGQLGELLDSGRTDDEYVQECRDLVDRSIALGKILDEEWAAKWALWCERHMQPLEHRYAEYEQLAGKPADWTTTYRPIHDETKPALTPEEIRAKAAASWAKYESKAEI